MAPPWGGELCHPWCTPYPLYQYTMKGWWDLDALQHAGAQGVSGVTGKDSLLISPPIPKIQGCE